MTVLLLCLLPKEKRARRPGKFRPLGLLQSFQKIVEMMLVMRWRDMLERTLPKCMLGFRRGKSAFECMFLVLHCFEKCKEFSRPCVAAKLDVKKAYDSVCWGRLFES